MEQLKQQIIHQLERTLESPTDYAYLSEQQLQDLRRALENEHNAHVRLQHTANPMFNSYGRDNGAEGQRY